VYARPDPAEAAWTILLDLYIESGNATPTRPARCLYQRI